MSEATLRYYATDPEGFAAKLATKKRREMYHRFIEEMSVGPNTTILDVGVTDDQLYESSNYLELWHPFRENICAVGMQDAAFLKTMGVSFVRANGLSLPFSDQSFDVVHCAATIEHVGNAANQSKLISECARVARRGFFMTTPNRWFPMEVHTQLPFLHWMPKRWHRATLSRIGHGFYATEENLNLMGAKELLAAGSRRHGFTVTIESIRVLGAASNLLLIGTRI